MAIGGARRQDAGEAHVSGWWVPGRLYADEDKRGAARLLYADEAARGAATLKDGPGWDFSGTGLLVGHHTV